MSLGGIVVATGILLARACDSYVAVRKGGGEGAGMGLEEALRASMNHKGRLLHYFPPQEGAAEDWCAVHTGEWKAQCVRVEKRRSASAIPLLVHPLVIHPHPSQTTGASRDSPRPSTRTERVGKYPTPIRAPVCGYGHRGGSGCKGGFRQTTWGSRSARARRSRRGACSRRRPTWCGRPEPRGCRGARWRSSCSRRGTRA